ncbi:sulfite exporter TauE/SafE family protein [Nocardioides marmoriginsengisoli]|nr:sulfite exporter TauE/SafE family protein [Nocardioides marmoriginsengisoli]
MTVDNAALAPLLVGLCVFFAASYVQAVTGFGAALVAVPLLLFFTDPATAVFASTLAGVFISGWASCVDRHHVSRPLVARLSGWALAGIPVGLVLITVLPDRALQLIIVLVVLTAAAAEILGERLHPTGRGIDACGFGAGALLASTGINGPPLVAALRGLAPTAYRATLQATFLLQDLVVVVALVLIGHASTTGLLMAVAGLAAIPLGWRIGSRTFTSLTPAQLRWAIVIGLLAAAAGVLVTG